MATGVVVGVVSVGVAGVTVTVNEPVFVWPRPSLAVQLTVVEPTGNALPEPGLQLIDTVWLPSVAEAL